MRVPKKYAIVMGLVLAVSLLSAGKIKSKAPDDPTFVGSAACVSCHNNIYASHIKTAHYLDSRPATAEAIKGSFKSGKNRFVYNDRMQVIMEKKNDHFFQTAQFNGNTMESEAFAIVIGSGRKGQSYLYWDGDRLFQLPISYYVPLDRWVNSPGYPSNLVYFNKGIHGQCMECHGTNAKIAEVDGRGTVFDSSSIIYGIDCERCHGPGSQHVAWHSAHPGELTGKYIVNAKRLSRQQRLDACALCHSGFREESQPSFSFRVGDTLDNYSTANYDTAATATLDVHGNQYGLLTASKCFRQSQMDCSSCHDPHANENGKMSVYSQRCLSCHNTASQHPCSSPFVKQMNLTGNCIDCHMPALASQAIAMKLSGKDELIHDLIRTHRVAVYADATRDFLAKKPVK
jgi:predicted CXXCH cytochrome family protein